MQLLESFERNPKHHQYSSWPRILSTQEKTDTNLGMTKDSVKAVIASCQSSPSLGRERRGLIGSVNHSFHGVSPSLTPCFSRSLVPTQGLGRFYRAHGPVFLPCLGAPSITSDYGPSTKLYKSSNSLSSSSHHMKESLRMNVCWQRWSYILWRRAQSGMASRIPYGLKLKTHDHDTV